MNLKFAVTVSFSIFLVSCSSSTYTSTSQEQPSGPPKTVAEKPFSSGGSIEMQLEGGDYTLRAASDNTIRVAFGGNTGNATADVTADGQKASVSVKNTPHSNFQATIDIPKSSNLLIHLSGGNLRIDGITGDKDVNSAAGNVEIGVSDPNEYATAEGSVTAGDHNASAFGKSDSGLNPHFSWQGPGKYKLQAKLGAGNLVISR